MEFGVVLAEKREKCFVLCDKFLERKPEQRPGSKNVHALEKNMLSLPF